MLVVSLPERTSIRTYRESFEGVGCRKGCAIHLMLLGVLALAMLAWAVRNRVWELEVTVEMPEKAASRESPQPASQQDSPNP